MPNYAFLKTDLNCPHCGAKVADIIRFVWGYCPASLPLMDYVYTLQIPVYWKEFTGYSSRAWAAFSDGPFNFGDPKVTDLIVWMEPWNEMNR